MSAFNGNSDHIHSTIGRLDYEGTNMSKGSQQKTYNHSPMKNGTEGDGLPEISAPQVSLPNGGGSIQSIEEKLSVNAFTGTASLEIPIFTTRGRQEFYPELSLKYDSGSGNGPFGLGFSLSVPSITRSTAKGLPEYRDSEESDTFILSGTEDLVPVFVEQDGKLDREVSEEKEDNTSYLVYYYQPRIEEGFIRIERWQNVNTGLIHWRTISKDHVINIYGKNEASRIAHPEAPRKIFQWRLEQSTDANGNIISYEYKKEDTLNVLESVPHEKNRLLHQQSFQNSYIKKISYGNKAPFQVGNWLFEVVFDYGDHPGDAPALHAEASWDVRKDPFSTFRAGFEVRMYRLCRRILMFHHFDELSEGPTLVRATDFEYKQQPSLTLLTGSSQTGYQWKKETGEYRKSSLPPIKLSYSAPAIQENIEYFSEGSLEHVPSGTDGKQYRWLDLDGEGLAGIVTQQGNALFYKRNDGNGRLGPLERVEPVPATADINMPHQQFMDVTGNGQVDLMQYQGTQSGYYERTSDGDWKPFVSLKAVPNIDWHDPNLRFLDLTGNGRSDILITEDLVFTYYPSEGTEGFGDRKHVIKKIHEEEGPNLVFSDITQSVYLADMSGDGLVDIVRIRNGEVCYWPNIGYARFGSKVTMGHAPRFSDANEFDRRRIRLADIDGTGATDLIYLENEKVSLWFNQSGNSWSKPHLLYSLPAIDLLSDVQVKDVTGSGTASLVWSTQLPYGAGDTMAYVDLMGGKKPYLVTSFNNQIGKEVKLTYAPSTVFYLKDKKAGRPWLTKLPFPVSVVERIEMTDHVTDTSYVTNYYYHHGYYDGAEKEFRGFAFVEQWDTEHYFNKEKESSPLDDCPPVLTKTWFHTGAFIDRKPIADQLKNDYYFQDEKAVTLRSPSLPADMTNEEKRQAVRAFKGKVLRQEVYAIDKSHKQDHPFQVVEHSYSVRVLQPLFSNRHAIFKPYEREALSYLYERDAGDPRMLHEFNLEVDEAGNVTRAAVAAYPRRGENIPDSEDYNPQRETFITYYERDFINRFDAPHYRLSVLQKHRTYEVTGIGASQTAPFTVESLGSIINELNEAPFDESQGDGAAPQKRLTESSVITYWKDDLSGVLEGDVESKALPYETYQMAFTPRLVTDVYRSRMNSSSVSESGYVERDGTWWLPSGVQTYDKSRFYLPVEYRTPKGATYKTTYDMYSLMPEKIESPATGDKNYRNTVEVKNNYRIMEPEQKTDCNGNRTEVHFDPAGMVEALAVMGKTEEMKGDSLAGLGELDGSSLTDSFADPEGFIKSASIRYIYDFHRYKDENKPVSIHVISRETHHSELEQDENTKVQQEVIHWDGFGRTVMTKKRAAPGKVPKRDAHSEELVTLNGNLQMVYSDERWIGSGKVVYDNKGHPVKQYEPFFSDRADYEDEATLVMHGVTPVMTYDPLGRLIRTDYPNGTISKASFEPWSTTEWDRNDTVKESGWFEERGRPEKGKTEPSDSEMRAAWLTVKHADTPSEGCFDPLGRIFMTVEENGSESLSRTRLHLTSKGEVQSIYDAEQRETAFYKYDMLGRTISRDSIDSGKRRIWFGIDNQPEHQWDNKGQHLHILYDLLGRPEETWLQQGGNPQILVQKTVYGESADDAKQKNLLTRVHKQFDQAGVVTYEYDFKGNLVKQKRELTQNYAQPVNWSGSPALESDTFTSEYAFDALNRVEKVRHPDESKIFLSYDEAGLLNGMYGYLYGGGEKSRFVNGITYNAKGQRKLIEYGNQNETRYEYDNKTFRLVRQLTSRPLDGMVLQDYRFTYDPQGNIVEIQDQAQQTVFFKNQVVSPHMKYEYDPLYRLTKAAGRERNQGENGHPGHQDIPVVPLAHPNDSKGVQRYEEYYDYDLVGNILKIDHRVTGNTNAQANWRRHYQYEDGVNRLKSVSLPGDSEDVNDNSGQTYSLTYEHDANGNIVQMPHLPQLHWNYDDQLTEVSLDGGGTEYYVCSYSGERIRKVHEHQGGTIEERIYLDGFEVYRKHRNNKLEVQRETLNITDDQARVALIERKTHENDQVLPEPYPVQRYQLENHLHSASLEVNESGQVISYEEYYPFGETSYHSGKGDIESSLKRYRYTGKERDEHTGLYYYGARYYAAWLGRWTSPDPMGLQDGMNVYQYVQNNPVKYIDPNGTESDFGINIVARFAYASLEAVLGSPEEMSASERDRAIRWAERGLTSARVIRGVGIIAGAGAGFGLVFAKGAATTGLGALGQAGTILGGTSTMVLGAAEIATAGLSEQERAQYLLAAELTNITNAATYGFVFFGEEGQAIGKGIDDVRSIFGLKGTWDEHKGKFIVDLFEIVIDGDNVVYKTVEAAGSQMFSMPYGLEEDFNALFGMMHWMEEHGYGGETVLNALWGDRESLVTTLLSEMAAQADIESADSLMYWVNEHDFLTEEQYANVNTEYIEMFQHLTILN